MNLVSCGFFVLMLSCVCMAYMKIVYLKEAAANDGAVCLDGSPAIYYWKPGSEANSTKWVFHIIGGGLCFNDEECLLRSKSYLGTSTVWPEVISYRGPTSENFTYNPDYYDWNHAFFVYCDGACFSGDLDEPVLYKGEYLYYRGHRILIAILKDLLYDKGLDKATDVLLVGDSAGAMSSFFHVDEIKSYMPKSVKRFKTAPFSGIFLDYPNLEGKPVWADNIKNVFTLQNCSGGVNQRCIAAMAPDEQYKCMFAEYTMEYIETPIMPIGSAYDIIGTSCIIGAEPTEGYATTGAGNCSAVPGWAVCEGDDTKCTKDQWDAIEDYGLSFMKRIENNPKLKEDGNGLFEYNCHTHAIECTDAWMLYETNGVIMRDAVREWYFSDNEPTSKHFYHDCVNHESYSCNPSCSIHF